MKHGSRSKRRRTAKSTKQTTRIGGLKVIEHGDIFFFYRPKIDAQEVKGIENVQRFYMITSPEKPKLHRIFLVGQKQLPEITEGKSSSEERNWALNILTSSNVDEIRKEFLPAEYQTETRGTRRIGAAVPVGEGKYSIIQHDDHSELVYILELPAGYQISDIRTWHKLKKRLARLNDATDIIQSNNNKKRLHDD